MIDWLLELWRREGFSEKEVEEGGVQEVNFDIMNEEGKDGGHRANEFSQFLSLFFFN